MSSTKIQTANFKQTYKETKKTIENENPNSAQENQQTSQLQHYIWRHGKEKTKSSQTKMAKDECFITSGSNGKRGVVVPNRGARIGGPEGRVVGAWRAVLQPKTKKRLIIKQITQTQRNWTLVKKNNPDQKSKFSDK